MFSKSVINYSSSAIDAPSCGITYGHHSDDSRGVIYDRNIFIKQATDFVSSYS